ncbi:hypothetical protein FD47_GL000265 [Lentilactobacillus parafarraginis DSM 18390 = JCM 14109]|jgi:hypothetical protein|uniref:Uncharacterized protein n=1 Tax=Lentilactobacillus parafarraginis DSM 18390 = JCM 14109 TaxID=1423786 RepID=A0A0R1YR34_9LACO|nr:hypothetical protein FD47_GL000265 [Lentilactobacillus parafarraginis DSM 18390 = JCM 14109]
MNFLTETNFNTFDFKMQSLTTKKVTALCHFMISNDLQFTKNQPNYFHMVMALI